MTEVHVVERKPDTIREALQKYVQEVARKDLRPRSIRMDYTSWSGYDAAGRPTDKAYDYTYASVTTTDELIRWAVGSLKELIDSDKYFSAKVKIRGIRKYRDLFSITVPDNARDFVIIKAWKIR